MQVRPRTQNQAVRTSRAPVQDGEGHLAVGQDALQSKDAAQHREQEVHRRGLRDDSLGGGGDGYVLVLRGSVRCSSDHGLRGPQHSHNRPRQSVNVAEHLLRGALMGSVALCVQHHAQGVDDIPVGGECE